MKLTKTQKDSFVKRVMEDVPRVDYTEKARKLIQAEAITQMPQPVLELFQNINLRHHLAVNYVYTGFSGQVAIFCSPHYVKSDELIEVLKQIKADSDRKWEERRVLENKIRAVIYSCSTLKMALRELPEFAEYLPRENSPIINNLPIRNSVAHLVTELMNAGWKQNENAKT